MKNDMHDLSRTIPAYGPYIRHTGSLFDHIFCPFDTFGLTVLRNSTTLVEKRIAYGSGHSVFTNTISRLGHSVLNI